MGRLDVFDHLRPRQLLQFCLGEREVLPAQEGQGAHLVHEGFFELISSRDEFPLADDVQRHLVERVAVVRQF